MSNDQLFIYHRLSVKFSSFCCDSIVSYQNQYFMVHISWVISCLSILWLILTISYVCFTIQQSLDHNWWLWCRFFILSRCEYPSRVKCSNCEEIFLKFICLSLLFPIHSSNSRWSYCLPSICTIFLLDFHQLNWERYPRPFWCGQLVLSYAVISSRDTLFLFLWRKIGIETVCIQCDS